MASVSRASALKMFAIAVGVAGAGLIVAGCSSSPPPARVPPALPGAAVPGATGATPANAPSTQDTVAGYRLGPGDQVRLTVFRHEDLSGEFEMDGEGEFSMPLVGDIEGRGLTARQLEDRIETRLKDEGYLIDPQVSIEVLNYRPFYIIGEVNNPGSYAYVNGMTVVNAVALAGGYTYRADQDDIMIKRGGSAGRPIANVGPSTDVLPGDIIEVPERWF
ncbi:MAG TPA: polysaccharide biosynthesis/export family protein [Geminicoccaceae bacterium]